MSKSIDELNAELIESRNRTTDVVLESLREIDKANLAMRESLDVSVTDRVSDFRDRSLEELASLVAGVDRNLRPSSTTPKRVKATERLVDALGLVMGAFDEINAALADVEDAV